MCRRKLGLVIGMQRPLVLVSLAFLAGILLAVEMRLPAMAVLPVALAFFLAALLAHYREKPAAAALLLLAFLALGALRAGLELATHSSELLGDLDTHLYLTGTVAAEPQVYEGRTVYLLQAEEVRQKQWGKPVSELVQLTVFQTERPALGYGDRLTAYGQLKLPPIARNQGEFDYRSYLARKGIYTQMALDGLSGITVLGPGRTNPFFQASLRVKDRATAIVEASLPREEAGVLLAILFGDQERLENKQVDVFKSLGLFHIFAVSGMQVAFVLLFFLQLGRLLRLGEKAGAGLALAGVFFYAALTGFTPSVNRASLMAALYLGATLANRKQDFYTSLAATALLILLWHPLDLYDTGFLLSFLATLGLFYLQPLFNDLLSFLPPWRAYPAITLAAQFGVLPLTARYFNLLSPAALLANLVVAPAVGAITVAGLGLILFSFLFPPAAAWMALACGAVLKLLLVLLPYLAGLPWAVFQVPTPGPFLMALSYLLLVAAREVPGRLHKLLLAAGRRPNPRGAAAFLLGLSSLAILFPHPARGLLEVTFLDVGQGSSIYIQTPGGSRLLVDGGGKPALAGQGREVGEKVVVPFLVRQGASKPLAVFNSHPDTDHLQGLQAVVQKLRPQLVITPPANYFSGSYHDFRKLANSREIPLAEAKRGQVLLADPRVRLEVLHPGPPLSHTRSDDNNNSLVIRLTYGQVSFLLTGDLEQEGMAELLRSGQPLEASVFAVPHHGSRYGLQEAFLEKVRPEAAVIQVGAGNPFGHPAPEVLEYWGKKGVPIYRNDREGAVTFWSDGQTWRVETQAQKRRPPPWEPHPKPGANK